jgi:hypothetical protein
MRKLIARLFGRNGPKPAPPPDDPLERETGPEVDDRLSDAQILAEYFSVPKAAKQALRDFVLHAGQHLGAKESARLARRVVHCIEPGGSSAAALIDGLVGDCGQRRGQWLLLHVDWKAAEEVPWQADELAAALGVAARWPGRDACAGGTSVAALLYAFGAWLNEHGHALLHVDTEGDSYAALAMPLHGQPRALELANEAQVKAYGNEEFRQRETISAGGV